MTLGYLYKTSIGCLGSRSGSDLPTKPAVDGFKPPGKAKVSLREDVEGVPNATGSPMAVYQ